jgi:hypothetical protein
LRAFAASKNAGSAGIIAGLGAVRRSADAMNTDERRARPANTCESSVAPQECGIGEADALGGERVGVSEGVREADAVPDRELLAVPVFVEELEEVAVAVVVAVAVLLPVAECVADAVGAKLGKKDKRVMTPGGTCGRPTTELPRTHGWGPPATTGERASDTLPEKFTRSAGTRPLRKMSWLRKVRAALIVPTPGGKDAMPSTQPGIHSGAAAPGGCGEPRPMTQV